MADWEELQAALTDHTSTSPVTGEVWRLDPSTSQRIARSTTVIDWQVLGAIVGRCTWA